MRNILFIAVLFIFLCSCAKYAEQKAPVLEAPKSAAVKEIDFSKTMNLESANIRSIAAADFNNDGYDDVAAGAFNDYSNVFINNKDGTFTKNPLITKKYNTEAIAVIDFDNDGNKDLILGNNQQPIVILKNNGYGSFSLYKELDKTVVSDIAVADFDNDGWQDFAVGTAFKDDYIYFNDKGEFSKTKYAEDVSVKSAVPGDIDNDGFIDLVVGLDTKKTRVYLNEKNRNFVLSRELSGDSHTYAIALFDSNKDGKLDIAQGNNKENNILFLNTVEGFKGKSMFGDGNTYALIAADFDNDNEKEVVVGDYEQSLRVYKKSGDGYYVLKEIKAPFRDFVRDFAIGDFNKDGYLDLAVAREKDLSQIYIS